MKLILNLTVILFWSYSFSQTTETPKDSLSTPKTEKKTSGGLQKFYDYIGKNFRTPGVSNFPGGKIIVQFTILTDGSLGNIKILKDIGYGTGDQILRILKNCPKWTPAVKDGKPVETTYTIPINVAANREDE